MRFKAVSINILLLITSFTELIAVDPPESKRLRGRITDLTSPIVEDDWKHHTIGNFWNRVTNFNYVGDDAYEGRTPSGDYPGGSGNSYLYRGTLWLSGFADGIFHSSQGSDHEFSPLDSVILYTGDDAVRGEQETYTKYYDVYTPLAENHTPLGLEITERTFAWSASFADDFIIHEYSIKNVGIDSDGDHYPDIERDITDFYFTVRLDADVSKLPDWGAEDVYSNIDDYVMSDGTNFDWLETIEQMAGVDHGLSEEDKDSSMMFMWDGDNRHQNAENGQPDDFGNPGVDGTLQSPGFIGLKVLKTEPVMPKHSFHVNHISNDPASDQEAWSRMISDPSFENIFEMGYPAYDYRGLFTVGPLDILRSGDSVIVTIAYGVGSDPARGSTYSLVDLFNIMNTAQWIVDNNYNLDISAMVPAAPEVTAEELIVNGVVTGIGVTWNDLAISHENFQGYKIWRGDSRTITGEIDWEPLGAGIYDIDGTWPPPSGTAAGSYQLVDAPVSNGFDYYYSVQVYTDTIKDPINLGPVFTSILDKNSFKVIAPANAIADNLNSVKVVPNPYIGSARWNNNLPSDTFPWQHRMQFTNLPSDAVVKIYSLDGDFIDEVHSGYGVRSGDDLLADTKKSVAEWDLITRNNQEAAPGIYMFIVDSQSLGQKVGKFVIIR